MRVSFCRQDVVSSTRRPTISLCMEARVRDEVDGNTQESEGYAARRGALEHYPAVGSRTASSSEVDPALGKGRRDDFNLEQSRGKTGFDRRDAQQNSIAKAGFNHSKDEWRLMEDVSQDVSRAFGSKDCSPFKDDYVIRNQSLYERRTRSLPAVSKSKSPSSSISFFQSTSELGKSILVTEQQEAACLHDTIEFHTLRNLSSTLRRQVVKGCLILVVGIAVVYLFMQFLLIAVPPMLHFKNSYLQNITSFTRINQGSSQCQIPLRAHPLPWVFAALILIVVGSRLVELQSKFWKRGRPTCTQCVDGDQNRCRVEEADERAARAQLAKQQFMAYVFHNIRVPFNAIVLGLGHMRATGEGERSLCQVGEKMDLVEMMLDCAETMTSVLDDVTDMGQWEVGQMEVHKDEFGLLGVINFLSWGLKELLDQNQISFKLNIDPTAQELLTMHNVIGDKQRIVQTLGNFLSNAIKFSHPGGNVELEVMCEDVVDAKEVELPSSSSTAPGLLRRGRTSSLSSRKSLKGSGATAELCSKAPKPRSYQKKETENKVARLRISVKDDGVGISEQDQLKLFEPYSFVSSGWVQKAGISGLGLSMARRFVEQVGGRIGVESEEGKGSTFHFCLPFPLVRREPNATQEVPAPCGVSPKDEQSTTSPVRPTACIDETFKEKSAGNCTRSSACSKDKFFRNRNAKTTTCSEPESSSFKRRVLLVEDTQINRIILRKVLQNLNLHCDEAENGKIAVDYYKEGRTYDLILMDKEMPVMDGHEATRQIRRMGVNTPIIALTGNAMPSDRELFFEAGVDDFQTKPLSRDKLVQLLSKFGVESSCVTS
ncbi:protein MpHK-like [Marchantia polymorpha subsp. ruderalis]|uniref:histidine kinase n=2 Tax=Marchantia polymorpha TaxID=3197 RepID=A0AAF6AVN0_MARPO|nr:hypothetical protein MARPO_0139s0007 [Marchantia polymorpha]BBN00501.1 hypothetical protein Mp_1g29670 [Marchantia polymorpha subsp. ruderalis]|eukprot:PTQ29529.1 hypothetical protein MARPO_0139s0007 [Marchantia polymorpha]